MDTINKSATTILFALTACLLASVWIPSSAAQGASLPPSEAAERFATLSGVTIRNATISSSCGESVTLFHEHGVTRVMVDDFPEERGGLPESWWSLFEAIRRDYPAFSKIKAEEDAAAKARLAAQERIESAAAHEETVPPPVTPTQELESEPESTQVSSPEVVQQEPGDISAAAPESEPEADGDGTIQLSVVRGWDTRHGGGRMVMEEFQSLLSGVQPNASLDIEPGSEIYRGIKLMMPVAEAIEAVGIGTHARLARSRVVTGGWPYESTFFHSFDFRADPPFNRLNLVTDTESRVIAVQLVNEAPTSSNSPNRPQNWGVYDFVNLKRKGANYTGVRVDVRNSGGLVVIDSWFINPRKSPNDIEQVRLFLPERIAQTVVHCLGNALNK